MHDPHVNVCFDLQWPDDSLPSQWIDTTWDGGPGFWRCSRAAWIDEDGNLIATPVCALTWIREHQRFGPQNPWVKDRDGRGMTLSDLLDRDYEREDEAWINKSLEQRPGWERT